MGCALGIILLRSICFIVMQAIHEYELIVGNYGKIDMCSLSFYHQRSGQLHFTNNDLDISVTVNC